MHFFLAFPGRMYLSDFFCSPPILFLVYVSGLCIPFFLHIWTFYRVFWLFFCEHISCQYHNMKWLRAEKKLHSRRSCNDMHFFLAFPGRMYLSDFFCSPPILFLVYVSGLCIPFFLHIWTFYLVFWLIWKQNVYRVMHFLKNWGFLISKLGGE